MRNPGGYLVGSYPDRIVERDTYTCAHCCKVTFVKPRERPEDLGGLCKCCMGLICSKCVDEGTCTPLEKRLQAMEARQDALRSYGLA